LSGIEPQEEATPKDEAVTRALGVLNDAELPNVTGRVADTDCGWLLCVHADPNTGADPNTDVEPGEGAPIAAPKFDDGSDCSIVSSKGLIPE